MNWLYRDDEVESTAVMRPDEVEAIRRTDRRRERAEGVPVHRPTPASRPASPPPPPPPAPPTRRNRRRRHPVRNVIVTIFVLWLAFLIGTPLYAWTAGTQVDAVPSGDRPADQPGTTVLLVGSDARDDLSAEDRSRLGTGSTEGRRTDTMMLLHTPTTGKPVLVSLPRDLLVEIPGRGRNKLNAAYAFGGPTLLVETVEQNTDVRVDGYLEIGFLGVVDVVDAVGGIEVCPTFDIDDRDSHLQLSQGCQTVDGVTALGYVRMRKADPRGDLGRVERQREVIAAISREVINPMSVLNPVRYWELNMAASSSLARGEDTGLAEMTQVARGFVGAMTGSGLSLTVPISNPNVSTEVGSAMEWDETASAEMFGAIAAGDTTELEKYRR